MDYSKYINSPEWRRKSKARMALDGNCCRLCDEDGTRYRLEVHHRPTSYAKIPNESIEDDLITVCSRCHDLVTSTIRGDRYGKRELIPDVLQSTIQARQEIGHGMANAEIQIDRIGPVDNAQRANGRPNKQMVEVDKADFIEARKDRR